MKSDISRKRILVLVIVATALLLFFEYYPLTYSENEIMNNLLKVIVTRTVGCFVFVPLSVHLGYNIFGLTDKHRIGTLLCTLVPLAVVVNNLPIIGLLSGNAYITESKWFVLIFALEALMIGMFEEFAFRAVLFPYILETRRSSPKMIFWATVLSSAAFGGVHVFNLFAGGGPAGVFLQIGYSFLIGGMCAIVLLYTRCIWICVALHAIYDFCGYLVPTLGKGIIWDPVTVSITAVLGVLAFVFMLVWLTKITPERVNEIYEKNDEASV